MANWDNPSDETNKAFDDVLINLDLERYIGIKIIVNNDQKDVGKLMKLNPAVKYAMGDDLLIIVNEVIFEQLPPLEQNMYVQELLCGVRFDAESVKLIINQPDVKTHSGFLQKFGYDKYEVMKESIKSLYDKKKEDDKEQQD